MRPASLYVGRTTHARREPKPHRFAYRIFQLMVDVDRIDEAFSGLALIRKGRFGLFTFLERDHGDRDGGPLRPWVERQLMQAQIEASAARIRLLTFPRVLGFVFNPISIVFVEDARGRLEAVVYEVNNTFGQTHAYVAPATGAACERHEADKALFVSPFYGVDGGYRFKLTPPAETFNLVIDKRLAGQTDFTATLSAERRTLTDRALLQLFLGMPLMTLGVVLGIHWQALKLWAKGVRPRLRPVGAKAGMSVGRASVAPS